MPEAAKIAVPYVPWKTFYSVLESLSKFLPEHVHPSMWQTYSGGVRSQLLASLRFLKLIEDDGAPTDLLKRISKADPPKWPPLLREALRDSYVSLMQCDLTRATPGSFDAEMRKFGQEGDTHRKAASFFLQAAKFAEVPLSPLLAKKGGLSASRKKKAATTRKPDPNAKKDSPEDGTDPLEASRNMEATGVKKVIHLDNDSVLSLVLNKNFGELPSIQRKFVNRMIDRMEAFVESDYKDIGKPENGED